MSFSPPEPILPENCADPAVEMLLSAARKRLRLALEGLDHALSRHNQLVFEKADQVAEYAALQDDRSRLAQELDAASGRVRLLEAANLEAAQRIERASATVRAVIGGDGPGVDFAADSASDPEREG